MYFIYDDQNYLNEQIDSKRMRVLYEKQENLYVQYGISNYIILVDNIDENLEDLETCAKETINSFSKKYMINFNKAINVLFTINSTKIGIHPGYISSIFSQSTCTQMINNLESYMRSLEYINALNKLIEDIEYFYNKNKPSTVIWKKVLNASDNGEIIIPENKRYFIYDEQNYLQEEINSTKMKALYKKQENIYTKNGIPNYIFLVNDIDENGEDLETCAKTIINYINNDFHYSLNKSIIALFSINSHNSSLRILKENNFRVRIQAEKSIESIFSENVCNKIINNLESYMNNSDYYNAIIKLIEDIYFYTTNNSSNDDGNISYVVIIIIVLILITVILVVIIYLYRRKNKKKSSEISFDYSKKKDGHKEDLSLADFKDFNQ